MQSTMEDDSVPGLQDVENETINAHTDDPLSDDNIEDGLIDHTRTVPLSVNTCPGAINYQSPHQGYVSVPAANVKIVKVVPLPHARSQVWNFFGFIADDDGEIQDKKKAICRICATTLAYSGNTTNLFTHLKAMHPEHKPSKLAPTNQIPRTGKKGGKRKLFDSLPDGPTSSTTTATSQHPHSQHDSPYVIKNVAYSGNESSSGSLFDGDGLNGAGSGGADDGGGNAAEDLDDRSPSVVKSVAVLNFPNSVGSMASTGEPMVSYDDITNAIVNMIVEDCRPICITQSKGFEELIRLLAPGYRIPDSNKLKPLVRKRQKEVQRNIILRGLGDD